jgi:hypothetical protein
MLLEILNRNNMALASLTVDVYCTNGEGTPSYRIYVDGEMLAEKSWTWPSYEVFVRERVDVNVEPGAHRLEVKECNCNPVFYVKDVTLNGQPNNGGLFFT